MNISVYNLADYNANYKVFKMLNELGFNYSKHDICDAIMSDIADMLDESFAKLKPGNQSRVMKATRCGDLINASHRCVKKFSSALIGERITLRKMYELIIIEENKNKE